MKVDKQSARRFGLAWAAVILVSGITCHAQNLDSLEKKFVAMKYGMILHFNMGTFTLQQWADSNANPNLFNPDSLNCGQWADAAVAAGMKYMTLTVKHHDGFCLWNSAYTTHDVGSSSWRNGKGDVVREFVDSCRSRGLGIGFYFSIWDRNHANNADTTFIKNQLKELLTNYGPITYLWFDGWGWNIPYSQVPWPMILNLVQSLQPNCLIANNNHENNNSHSLITEWENGSWNNYLDVAPNNALPSELIATLINSSGNDYWFYPGPSLACGFHDTRWIVSLLMQCNSRNSNLVLDVSPDQHGRVPQCQVQRLKEIANTPDLALNKTVTVSNYYQNQTQYQALNLVDGNWNTRWATDPAVSSATLTVDFGSQTKFNSVAWGECTDYGQRIKAYVVQYWDGAAWKTLVTGGVPASVPVQVDTFPAVQSNQVRLALTNAPGGPTLWEFGVFNTGSAATATVDAVERAASVKAVSNRFRLTIVSGAVSPANRGNRYDIRGRPVNRAATPRNSLHVEIETTK